MRSAAAVQVHRVRGEREARRQRAARSGGSAGSCSYRRVPALFATPWTVRRAGRRAGRAPSAPRAAAAELSSSSLSRLSRSGWRLRRHAAGPARAAAGPGAGPTQAAEPYSRIAHPLRPGDGLRAWRQHPGGSRGPRKRPQARGQAVAALDGGRRATGLPAALQCPWGHADAIRRPRRKAHSSLKQRRPRSPPPPAARAGSLLACAAPAPCAPRARLLTLPYSPALPYPCCSQPGGGALGGGGRGAGGGRLARRGRLADDGVALHAGRLHE